jgi:hypothetical protein
MPLTAKNVVIMLRRFLWKLTGGRPMLFDGFAFTDIVVNRPVYNFECRNGRRWMAYNKWGLFRVECPKNDAAEF